jgi:hypothetical protein
MTAELIVNHLWQSSCFALLAGLLAFMLRENSPKVRYWVWLSASLKFFVPWALLMSLGSAVPRPSHQIASAPATPTLPDSLVQMAEPFSPSSVVGLGVPQAVVKVQLLTRDREPDGISNPWSRKITLSVKK